MEAQMTMKPGTLPSTRLDNLIARRKTPGMRACLLLALTTLLPAFPLAIAQSVSFGSQPVGRTSAEHSVTITAQAAGSVAAVQVLTLGNPGLDFAPGASATTCSSATLNVGQACTASVTFTPASPGVRSGAVVLLDSSNTVLGVTYLSGNGSGGLGVLLPVNVMPVAGSGMATGPLLDGNIATTASLSQPAGVTLDAAGNLYIADTGHNRIRAVAASTGIISTLAGNGVPMYAGDGLVSTNAAVGLSTPSGVALDGAGNLYIADTGNNVIRRIAASTGIITTVAGNGTPGGSGDGLAATAATLNQPRGVSVDSSGNLYIADTANHRIRRVNPVTGIISTVAGNGTTNTSSGAGGYSGDNRPAIAAELNFPFSVGFDSAGNMYIPDSANNVVRMVAAVNGQITAGSVITTFAGTGMPGDTGDGAAATQATLNSPTSVTVDAAGNLYFADTQNSAIRKVSGATGFISTIAESGQGQSVDSNGNPYTASIQTPSGLALDGSGSLLFADAAGMRVSALQSNVGVLDFTATPIRQGSESAPQAATVENDGNAPLALDSIAPASNAALDASLTTCAIAAPLQVNAACAIGAIFAPTAPGNTLLGQIAIVADTANSPLNIELIGDASSVNPTRTSLVSSANPAGLGQPVTFTAAVTGAAGSGPFSGSVTFNDGANPLGPPVPVNASGLASYLTSSLSAGQHSITAVYGGDAAHSGSTSPAITQSVLEATSTTLVSSANPAAQGQSITLTATVAASGAATTSPAGAVTFTDGANPLATVPLNSSGIATLTTSTLAAGLHSITATYNGDAANQISGSVSNLLQQEVLVASQVAIASAPNPSNYGNAVTFTVTATSAGPATPTGAVTILDGGSPIGSATLIGSTGAGTFITAALYVGSHTITASYLGDTSNAPSTSAFITQVINPPTVTTPTSTIASASPNPAVAGALVSISASVQVWHGMAPPTGAITFSDTFNGVTVPLGTSPVNAADTAAIGATFAVGTHSIVATYGGNAVDAASTSSPFLLMVQQAATAVVLASSPNPSIADSAVTFTATVTSNGAVPTGTITFLADGASIGSAPLSAGGTATLTNSSLTPGTHSVIAAYSGDANNTASTSFAISQVVDTIPTTTTLTSSASAGGTVSLVATVTSASVPTPTGTVTFLVGTTILGTAPLSANGAATLIPTLADGSDMVVASYVGDALHAPSASQPAAIAETASGFTLNVTPSTMTMGPGQSSAATLSLASTGNFADTVALACSGLPKGVTCRFSNPDVGLTVSGVGSAQLIITTANVVAQNSSHEDIRTQAKSASLAGLFLPLSAAFACFFVLFGRLRRKFHAALLLLLLGCAAALATGCTSVNLNSNSAGAYSFRVTATGKATGAVQSQTVTLNITH
jgi:sugar lactone lactonase YvrE